MNNLLEAYKIHGSLMFISFICLMPLAIALARNRVQITTWFPWHIGIMFTSFLLVVSSLFVIYSVAGNHVTTFPSVTGLHHKFGLSIILLLFLQISYGIFIHGLRKVYANTALNAKQVKIARMLGFGHRFVGTILLLAGFYNVLLGLIQYGADTEIIYIAGGIEAAILVVLVRM